MIATTSRLDRFDRLVVALIIVVLCAALAIVARPLNAFFNEPLLDDGYYVLTIARHIALGQGVTADGTTLSNGFQPLWTFLCAALFWLSDGERVSGVRYVLVLHWLLYALGAFLAAALAERVFAKSTDRPRSAALIAALVFLSSSFIWSNGFNGMETSLSIACLLAAMLCYVSIDRKNRLHLAGCGALLGLVVLARVDAVFFVILLSAMQLVRRDVGWTGADCRCPVPRGAGLPRFVALVGIQRDRLWPSHPVKRPCPAGLGADQVQVHDQCRCVDAYPHAHVRFPEQRYLAARDRAGAPRGTGDLVDMARAARAFQRNSIGRSLKSCSLLPCSSSFLPYGTRHRRGPVSSITGIWPRDRSSASCCGRSSSSNSSSASIETSWWPDWL